jgi:hypothetical protein
VFDPSGRIDLGSLLSVDRRKKVATATAKRYGDD